jgi:hypothetical protein
MLLQYSTHKVFTSHFKSSQDDCSQLPTHELPAAVSHRELAENHYSRTTCKWAAVSPINPWSDMQKNRPLILLCHCGTRRSRDPSPLLRYPSVYSCCLATNEARWCDSSRHSRPGLSSARRRHRFVYCCTIMGTCFDVTVLSWRKYATMYTLWNHHLFAQIVLLYKITNLNFKLTLKTYF